jgi:hypothetical protein
MGFLFFSGHSLAIVVTVVFVFGLAFGVVSAKRENCHTTQQIPLPYPARQFPLLQPPPPQPHPLQPLPPQPLPPAVPR